MSQYYRLDSSIPHHSPASSCMTPATLADAVCTT